MLKLIPPKTGRPSYYVRGSHVGVRIYRSTTTADKAAAKRVLKTWRQQIERGEFRQREEPVDEPVTFAQAALAYLNAGGDGRFLARPTTELGRMPLANIDQLAIDAAAVRAFPNASAATRNRCFYTPTSAVLRHVGVKLELRRPKGWRGKRSTSWLEPEQAFATIAAADQINPEFGLLLRVFLYTGRRLSEVLNARLSELNLERHSLYLPDTKNGEPATVHLPGHLSIALANHPRGLDRPHDERIFRFHNGGRLRNLLKRAFKVAGVQLPFRQAGFHVFSHTYGTWMRRYGGLDTYDLVETGRWKDPASAARYVHSETSAAARRADLLPQAGRKAG